MSIDRHALIRATAIGTVLQRAMVLGGHYVPAIALAGGLCALLGIAVSFALGDVTAVILAGGTLSSAVGGMLGGWIGGRLAGRGSLAASG